VGCQLGGGEGLSRPSDQSPSTWEKLAAFTGPTYLRYSFTKGTDQEVGFLIDALGLRPGDRVLDVGCGPGRHALALAGSGMSVAGVDLAEDFLRVAATSAAPASAVPAGEPAQPRFVRGDARCLPIADGSFDAAVCLCHGGFGLLGDDGDLQALGEMTRVLRPGGRLALSAFSAYFAVRFLEDGEDFEASSGGVTESSIVRDPSGRQATFVLRNATFTPRELRLMTMACGLELEALWSVAPGSYQRRAADIEHPEWLILARRASATL
jgi:SAM-dependent methyltransferase